MRNLLFILILANVLYFLWGMLTRNDEEAGVAVIEAEDLGPPLPSTRRETESESASGSDGETGSEDEETLAEVDSETESNLTAVVGRSCVTIGPFRTKDDADVAQTRYASEKMRTAIREGTGEYFVGHWVQIRNVPDDAESRRMLSILHDAGLTDAYPVETEDEGKKISLGLFGNVESAERIEQQAQELGLPAEIRPRMSEGDVHWVDVELPPGRGAGAIVERYGEEQVRLRDAATCP